MRRIASERGKTFQFLSFTIIFYYFYSLIYLEMEFTPASFSVFIDKFESMTSIAIHVAVTFWSSSITEQKHDLMCGLWTQGNEIPKHIRVLKSKTLKIYLTSIMSLASFNAPWKYQPQ